MWLYSRGLSCRLSTDAASDEEPPLLPEHHPGEPASDNTSSHTSSPPEPSSSPDPTPPEPEIMPDTKQQEEELPLGEEEVPEEYRYKGEPPEEDAAYHLEPAVPVTPKQPPAELAEGMEPVSNNTENTTAAAPENQTTTDGADVDINAAVMPVATAAAASAALEELAGGESGEDEPVAVPVKPPTRDPQSEKMRNSVFAKLVNQARSRHSITLHALQSPFSFNDPNSRGRSRVTSKRVGV